MAYQYDDFKLEHCTWGKIEELVETFLTEERISVDSFWEEHVLGSNHYTISLDGAIVGFFSIHQENLLTLFYIHPLYRNQSQLLFETIKRTESVNSALVASSDEFFLTHALDNYIRLEKQAYFSVYTEKPVRRFVPLKMELADVHNPSHLEVINKSGDFLGDSVEKAQKDSRSPFKIYLATKNGVPVGFGVVEYGQILKSNASIGMFVFEDFRRQGIAGNILKNMQTIVNEKGYTAHSGCWYYNHNSKKSSEFAGAYAKSRLLKFFF